MSSKRFSKMEAGLPLTVEKAKAGFKTIGFDIQESNVKMVNDGINYIGDVVNEGEQHIPIIWPRIVYGRLP